MKNSKISKGQQIDDLDAVRGIGILMVFFFTPGVILITIYGFCRLSLNHLSPPDEAASPCFLC
jgi:hypothetical protein